MRTRETVAAGVVLLTLSLAAPAAAQMQIPPPPPQNVVAIGWTVLHEKYGYGHGPELNFAVARVKRFDVIVDGSFNRFDGFTEVTVMGGLRVQGDQYAALIPFGQLLVGIERCGACKTTDPTVEPGGGIDLALGKSHRVYLRGAAGYRITPSARRTFKETHVTIGIVLRRDR